MSKKVAFWVITVLFVLSITITHSQSEKVFKLHGIVINKKDQKPVLEAKITLVGLKPNTATDESGNFYLYLENVSSITMKVTKEGFKPFTLEVNLPLAKPLEIEIEPISEEPGKIDLEIQLIKVKIHLTDIKDKEEEVRDWLKNPSAGYINLAENVLKLLQGGKPKGKSVPLDVICGKYRKILVGDENKFIESYDDMNVLKKAYVKAWKDKNSDLPYDSFEEITGISAIK